MGQIDVLLLDLDGVVRRFDPAVTAAIEQRCGLRRGAILSAAFEPRLYQAVTTGAMTRAAWVAKVGEVIGPVAATAWAAQRASVDKAVLEAARAIRRSGVQVCLLTNGTDRVATELTDLGIAGDFDAVFNSAEIGYAKPDLRIFLHVLRELGVARSAVFYLDDSPGHIRSAAALGIEAHLFTSARDLDHVRLVNRAS